MEDKVKLGPFAAREVDDIEGVFKSHGVDYTVEPSQETLQRNLNKSNRRISRRGQPFAAEFVFFSVAKADLDKVLPALEKFGVAALSDGTELNVGDFICPQCHQDRPTAGSCETCRVQLVPYTQFAATKNGKYRRFERVMSIILLITAAIVAFHYLSKNFHI